MLTAAGQAWAAAGLGRVIGITPSQSARNTLAAGVPESYNTAQFPGHLPGQRGARGPIQLRPGDLVLMDEASMVSNPDLADVISQAADSGAKVILAGDTQQLQAVENGGGLSLLAGALGFGLAVITGTEDRQHAYVALSRGTDTAREAFGPLYLDVLGRFYALFGRPMPYIAAWHQAPVRDEAARSQFAAHLQVLSVRRAVGKLKYLAGTESGMGVWINDIVPEEAAQRLGEAL